MYTVHVSKQTFPCSLRNKQQIDEASQHFFLPFWNNFIRVGFELPASLSLLFHCCSVSSSRSEVTKSGLSCGLLVDWLERLDPEVTTVCPDLQQKLLFALNKVSWMFTSPHYAAPWYQGRLTAFFFSPSLPSSLSLPILLVSDPRDACLQTLSAGRADSSVKLVHHPAVYQRPPGQTEKLQVGVFLPSKPAVILFSPMLHGWLLDLWCILDSIRRRPWISFGHAATSPAFGKDATRRSVR